MKKITILDKTIFSIDIVTTPENLNVEGVQINQCTNNAKLIIENNKASNIIYVEGFLLIIQDGIKNIVPHAWNLIKNKYFDSTHEELLKTTNIAAEGTKLYFPVFKHKTEDLPEFVDGILPFTEKFKPYAIDAMSKYSSK